MRLISSGSVFGGECLSTSDVISAFVEVRFERDRHGVHTLQLTVQQNLDFSTKCFSSISTWLEKGCAIEKYFF